MKFKNNILLLLLFPITAVFISAKRKELTASSEALLWKPVNKTLSGISSVWEAYILAPADYEAKDSPFIPINVRKFVVEPSTRNKDAPVNLWYVPGGPGQSSQTVEVVIPAFIQSIPGGSCIYTVDHRGLGKSTPLANDEDKALLENFPSDQSLLPEILERKQRELGISTPLIRALRVENVARDLVKSIELSRKLDSSRKNYFLGVSYGTMVARRVLQLAPRGTFEAVILDGLAPVERIEVSNESDRTIGEFCTGLSNCKTELERLVGGASGTMKVRKLIPQVLASNPPNAMNSCTNYLLTREVDSKSLCSTIHEILNSALLQGRTSMKVAVLRMLFEMIECRDPTGFQALVDTIHRVLSKLDTVNHLQSAKAAAAAAAVIVSSAKTSVNSGSVMDPEKSLSADELVFEVISALERYDVTEDSFNICYNLKHVTHGDDRSICPARLFDPCKFFQMTYDRKISLMKMINGSLPQVSLQNPQIDTPDTRIIVLAGSLDFNTPTWISRQLTRNFIRGRSVVYNELFGLGHGIFGSTDCDDAIFSDFLKGGNRSALCMAKLNQKSILRINEYFSMPLGQLAYYIKMNT